MKEKLQDALNSNNKMTKIVRTENNLELGFVRLGSLFNTFINTRMYSTVLIKNEQSGIT